MISRGKLAWGTFRSGTVEQHQRRNIGTAEDANSLRSNSKSSTTVRWCTYLYSICQASRTLGSLDDLCIRYGVKGPESVYTHLHTCLKLHMGAEYIRLMYGCAGVFLVPVPVPYATYIYISTGRIYGRVVFACPAPAALRKVAKTIRCSRKLNKTLPVHALAGKPTSIGKNRSFSYLLQTKERHDVIIVWKTMMNSFDYSFYVLHFWVGRIFRERVTSKLLRWV